MEKGSSSRVMRGGWTIGAIFLMLTALLLAACGGGQGGGQRGGGGQQDAQNVTLDEVTGSPQNFYSQTVTVTGAVGQYVEPRGLVVVPGSWSVSSEPAPRLLPPKGFLPRSSTRYCWIRACWS